MVLGDVLDAERFASAREEGLIDLVPFDDRWLIVHYSDAGERHSRFDPTIAACRGLLVAAPADAGSVVAARPWPRFGDYGSVRLPRHTTTPGLVFEKLDGALIVAARVEGETLLWNRRRRDTVQAARACELLDGVSVPDGVTAMFELIDPVSRVAVDYGDLSALVLTGVTDSDSGGDRPLSSAFWWPGEVAHCYGRMSVEEAWRFATSDAMAACEGVVVTWPKHHRPGFRLKMKHPDWVARARRQHSPWP